MRINIRNISKPKAKAQIAVTKHDKDKRELMSFTKPLYITWAKVTAHSAKFNTVNVELQTGIALRNISVRSLEWAGSNSIGYGERDLPPIDCKVLLLFPDGIIENGFVLCSELEILGSVGEKHKDELLVEGEEDIHLRIREGGLKETYDKTTGEYTLEINDAIINIDANGGIVITPASGENIELAGNTKNLVTHAELDTALQNFITALNTHVHSGVTTGGGTSAIPVTPMSVDISLAEATRLETS